MTITMSESQSVFEQCSNNESAQLQCISDLLEEESSRNNHDITTWFLIFAAAMIFFLQGGFAMICAGSVQKKNVGNSMLKNLLDAVGAAISFFAVGYAFAFGGQDNTNDTTFIGTENFFMVGLEDRYAFWVFQFAFAATSTTIVAGTLAERCQMAAYLAYSVTLTGFVYPVIAHAVWSNNGFLSAFNISPPLGVGAIDFAGSGVVHITGGATALWATVVLGPRRGRFYDARNNPLPKPKPFPGHSIALQMLGTFILWFGWYAFNAGSALTLDLDHKGDIASLAAVNTTLSAAAGGVTALFVNLWIIERRTGEAHFEIVKLMNGCLSGLVAITAGCAVVEPWASVIIGFIAGLLYLGGSALLIRWRLDDAVDAIPVHLVNGLWGVFVVGLLAEPNNVLAAYGQDEHVGWFYKISDASLLACQIFEILFISGWVFFLMFPFFIWLNYMGWFRSDSLEELVGLDISYHGGNVLGDTDVKLEYVEAFNRRRGRTPVTPSQETAQLPYDDSWVQQPNTELQLDSFEEVDETKSFEVDETEIVLES